MSRWLRDRDRERDMSRRKNATQDKSGDRVMRKIMQIAVAVSGSLVALCDDGSVWSFAEVVSHGDGPKWHLWPPIPQDQPQAKDSAMLGDEG